MKNSSFTWLAIGWFVLCTILLVLPGSAFPKENWLQKIYFDKWVHIGIFSGMTYLWSAALGKNSLHKIRVAAWVALAAFGYGIAIEFIQKYWVPNRSFDVFDIMADGAGCLLGYFVFTRWHMDKKKTPVETGVVNQN